MNVAICPPRILSICAGVGGIDLGIRLAVPGARTVCFVEREACAAATLVARMEEQTLDKAPIWDDLSTFDGRPWRGAVDLIAAGLPCQPYSLAGTQKGNADDRAIWPEFVRVVGEVCPPLVFIENVSTFVTRGWFRPAGEKLCELGYEIEDPFFLRAGDVGAPHRRERVFILAHRTGGRQTEWPGRRCGELDHSDSRRSESTEHLICPRGDIAELAGGELANAQCIRCADGGPTPQIRPEARPECRGTGHHASTQPPPCINSASTMPSSCGRPPQPTRRSRDRTNRTDDGGNLWSALRGDRPGRGSGQRRGQGWGPSGGQ
ncbi:MAG: DNA cytosine methyltransferase [Gemmatimonadetes bacterium]|nr:DNA cytosine methyltransferase [Gemmatimonadota bacterium]